MSKFVSFVEDGDNLIFTTDDGLTETVVKGSKIAEILLAEIGVTTAPEVTTEPTPEA